MSPEVKKLTPAEFMLEMFTYFQENNIHFRIKGHTEKKLFKLLNAYIASHPETGYKRHMKKRFLYYTRYPFGTCCDITDYSRNIR